MTNYLLDTSALVRLHRQQDIQDRWRDCIDGGVFGVCSVTELELLYTAKSLAHRREIQQALTTFYAWVLMPDAVYRRASEVQEMLTQRGQHRSAGPVDLLVAATAELTSRTLLHYDRDFQTITDATGQAAQWLAPPGSID